MVGERFIAKLSCPTKTWEYMLGAVVITFMALADESIIPNVIVLKLTKIACILWVALRILAISVLNISFGITSKTQQMNKQRNEEGYIGNTTNNPPSAVLKNKYDTINKQNRDYQIDSPIPCVCIHIPSILNFVKCIVERLATKCK
jgi:hypothetical protein